MIRHQRGLTMTGLLFFALLLGFVAYTASRLLPAYLDYWAVKKALVDMSRDPSLSGAGLAAYRDAFDKRLYVSNITDVGRKDLEMEKRKDGVRLMASWTVRKPFIGPVNLCLDFKADSATVANP
jgi:hypothetical protein